MPLTKKTDTAEDTGPKKLPANTPAEQDQIDTILAQHEDEDPDALPPAPQDETAVDELPEGAVLMGGFSSVNERIADATEGLIRARPAAAFVDEHVGQPGSFVVGDDGVRRPAYERYQVPAPGKKGEKGEMVTKYRRVM